MTKLPSRAEMIQDYLESDCPHDEMKYKNGCEICTLDLLARRDEMVIEWIMDSIMEADAGYIGPDGLRALKGKLR